MNNLALIPELRFPEFKYDGTWIANQIADLGHFLGGGTPDRTKPEYWAGNIPWISSSDINEDDIHTISITRFINDISVKESAVKIIPIGSVLFVSRVGVGKLAINKVELCTSQDFTSFVPNQEVLNHFVGYFFSSNKNFLESLNQGTSIKGFSKSDFEKFQLPYPKNIKEQQKIASFLSSIDELIGAETAYLSSLQNHKKGLMQKLFPQEGEKVPALRFKEFEGDWAIKKLGEVFSSYSGGTPSTTEKGYYGGNIPFIRSAEIHKSSTELYLTEEGIKNSSAKMVEKGDLLIAMYGANSGEVAISKITGAINQAILCLKSEFSNEFTCQYFIFKKDWITTRFLQGGQGNLSGDIIKSIEFYFPSKMEQQKIASCLSSLDDLIAAQTQKIEQLKLHKKGLMQGLFPKID